MKSILRGARPATAQLLPLLAACAGAVMDPQTVGGQGRPLVTAVLVEGEDIEYPNGLLVEGDRLVVGGWGEPGAGSSTTPLGRLFTIDLVTRRKTLITPLPFANIDGVEQDGRGGYLVSDWKAGKVAQVSASGVVTPLLDLSPGVADFSFLPGQDVLILPHMKENKVVAYDLSPMLSKIKEKR